MKTKLFSAILMLALFAVPSFAKDYFVTPDGNGNMDGSSWENAMTCESLVNGLQHQFETGDVVRLAVGIYRAEFNVPRGITLIGGYDAATGVVTDMSHDATIFASDGVHVLTITSDYLVSIENIRLEGSGDKLIRTNQSTLKITNCILAGEYIAQMEVSADNKDRVPMILVTTTKGDKIEIYPTGTDIYSVWTSKPAQATVFNTNGSVVKNLFTSTDAIEFDMSDQPDGVYLINALDTTIKFIK